MLRKWWYFLADETGAYGAEHALIAGVVAGVLVFGASWFWQDLSSLLAELGCTQASGCVVKVEQAAVPASKDPAFRPTAVRGEEGPRVRRD